MDAGSTQATVAEGPLGLEELRVERNTSKTNSLPSVISGRPGFKAHDPALDVPKAYCIKQQAAGC